MHLTIKILCTLFFVGIIQFADCYPQFSIPFVSWNKNKQELSKLTLNIQNPLSSFGKNKQFDKNRGNNEVVHIDEKIIPVTPNPGTNYDKIRAQTQTTQDPRIWAVEDQKDQSDKDLKKEKPNVETRNNFNEIEEKQIEYNFSNDDINKIFRNYDLTTESTTEYESTTTDEYSDLYRTGVSGHVVASLLG